MTETQQGISKKVYFLALGLVLVKLLLLPFAQTMDADAVSRIYLALDWLKEPHWIATSVWAPFHFYLNGMVLAIWNDPILAPKVANILLASATLLPFYTFTRREFNAPGAWIATIFLAICPILFRNSFLALSGPPFLFFLVLAMNQLSRGIRNNNSMALVLAGLAITVAAGFRYEAWLIMALFGGLTLLRSGWKQAFLFSAAALFFPVVWMVSNWLETGNALHSIQGNYHWTLEMMSNNDNVDLESYLRRIWYFPFSWMIAVGAPVAFVILRAIFQDYKRPFRLHSTAFWSIPFWALLAFMLYNSFQGTLLLQHRFTGTLVVFSLPFVAAFFPELTRRKVGLAIGFGVLTVGLSFVYNTKGVKPVPRLKHQSGATMAQVVQNNVEPESTLILDFIGWENTYFIALQSGLQREQIVIVGGAKNEVLPIEGINQKMREASDGVVLLKKGSPLYEKLSVNEGRELLIKGAEVAGELLYEDDSVVLLRW